MNEWRPTLQTVGARLISSTLWHMHGGSDDGNLAVGIGLVATFL